MPEGLDLDPRLGEEDRIEPAEDLVPVQLGQTPGQVTHMGSQLNENELNQVKRTVRDNRDLFAWHASDMPGIDPKFLCHRLAVCRDARPIAQKKRKMGDEKRKAADAEVKKLLHARFIREVTYTTWLANIVLVRKANGKWRMCTDYTDLNKACPKDAYPLPCIDRLVDGASGHSIFSFLDAYSGYNQIRMHLADEEKMAFITESANFCYKVMPFGLKNARATYQRLMDKVFKGQMGRNIEIYVDDMVVKSNSLAEHLADLAEIFGELRKHNMRLNPEKCTFGVRGGKFLGFMLSARGIEANRDKCQAVLDMRSPTNLKELQRLSGRLVALSRFLPRLGDKISPMTKLLRKASTFLWDERCETAFVTLKTMLASPPILRRPDPLTPLLVYLAVSDEAISSVLVQEKEGAQAPIYFVSRLLQDAETRYQLIEKVALRLVHTSRRLRHYFQSHRVVMHTDCPISKVLGKPELAGRMMAWSVELSQFDISFRPRGPIKAQCLVDFVNELHPRGQFEEQWWTLHVDGSSNGRGSGAGVILEGPRGIVLEQSLRFRFKASNNQAEYEALLAGLRVAEDMGASKVKCLTDSKVVAEQVGDNFQVKDHMMQKYYHTYQKLKTGFQELSVEHIPRENNTRADQLARLAATKKLGHLRTIIQQEIDHPSVESEMFANVESECAESNDSSDWRTEITAFLVNGITPTDPAESKRLRTQATRYVVIGGQLYRRGFSTPLLKCLNTSEADYVTREVHEGICGMHSGARTTVAKLLRAGYYWPTMNTDCATFVKKCQSCQRHGNLIHQPAEQLHCIAPAWPFATWGADILGPFPVAKGQCKFLIVAVDLFTKWIEAEPLASISAHQVQNFLWRNVITRFGIPHTLVTDNGLQFTDRRQNEFLKGLGVQHRVTSVEHPQTNGQAESANKVILAELKKRLGEAKGTWAEQLPEVLWAYRCTPQSTTQETPFRLVYGSDAMIPVEIGEPTFRRTHFDESNNSAELCANLDTLEHVRDRAQVVAEATKQRYKRRFDSKVKPRAFREGDLVWRATGEARKEPRHGKLAPNWDGPFRIRHNLNNGAYKLEYLSGEPIPRTWNSTHLKVYYS
uniref:Retrovirus-related Pol polyprotein from transposon 17.6 n=1 Tax=Cajanus cajan TaxID=3821 RepID=A0A151SAY3_CAJCA|nr:Retrovirus-related Pol polyprotein from transposon 17.6 [Cajanus cajan]